MQRGQVDCTVGPLAYLQTLKLAEVSEWVHGLAFQPYYGATVLTFNKNTWDELEEPQQQAVKDNLAELVRNVTEGYLQDGEAALEDAKKAGIQFVPASDEDKKRLSDYVKTEYERVLSVARERGVGGAEPEATLDTLVRLMDEWKKRVAEMGNDDFDAYQKALQDQIFSRL